MNSAQLLPAVRDLYSRQPEYWYLYALTYTDELENEAVIAAAVEVARSDYPQWRAA